MFERWFGVRAAGSTLGREILGGVTTFLVLSYIVFLNPAILSGQYFGAHQPTTGIPFEAALAATCLAAAIGTLIMGIWGRLPVAQAPGMGENFTFVLTVLPIAAATSGAAEPWRVALAAVVLAGLLLLLLSLAGLHRLLIDALPGSLKWGIAAGIGLFIAELGLRNAGIIVATPDGMSLGNPLTASWLAFAIGILITAALVARGWLWGIAAGIAVTLIAAILTGQVRVPGVTEPGVLAQVISPAPLLFGLDFTGALNPTMLLIIVMLVIMVSLDASGTLLAVGNQAGQVVDDRMAKGGPALQSVGAGATLGGLLGASPVVPFIESAAGVASGARTGLASVVTGLLLLTPLLIAPVIALVGQVPVVTAPALVIVGALMVRQITRIAWDDLTEGLPAVIALIAIPLSGSIADGIALALVSYPVIRLLAGRLRGTHPLTWMLAAIGLAFLLIDASLTAV